MLKKGTIKGIQQDPGIFLSSLSVVPKKDSGHRPAR